MNKLSGLSIVIAISLLAAIASISAASDTPVPQAEDSTSLTERPIISLPEGEPPVIDGTMSPGEWNSARVDTFFDGSELLFLYSEGSLYLGIRANSPETIVGNIFICRGDEIAILHSSAALGTALYQKGPDSWDRSQEFVWRCRTTATDEAAKAEHDAFFEKERWVSINARMGTPNELEFRIEVTDETLRMAVNFIRFSDQTVKVPWPIDLDDDCIKPTPGGMPAQMDFAPDTWAAIAIPASER